MENIKAHNHMKLHPERYGMEVCKYCDNYYNIKSECINCHGSGLVKTMQRKRVETVHTKEV